MIILFAAKYLFYLWIGIFVFLSLFDEKGKYSTNKIFLYIIGFLLWVLHELHAYINGGFSILGFLGLSLNLIMIFVGLYMIKDKEDRNFGYVWTGVWTLILIYLLN